MKQSAFMVAVKEFLKSTTLHGFKYLASKNYADRIGWLACCCASACCAAVLCAVLRARFQEVPALLILRDLREGAGDIQTMPTVAMCPAAEKVADVVMQQFPKQDTNTSNMMRSILSRVINGNTGQINQLQFLEQTIRAENLSVPDFLFDNLQACRDLLIECRWQEHFVPCEELFYYEMTNWGICCVMKPSRLTAESLGWSPNPVDKKLDLSIDCNNNSFEGCQFYTKYDGQDWVETTILNPGFFYLAQITFQSEYDLESDKLIDSRCVSSQYSRSKCRLQCLENGCGCFDPFRNVSYNERETLPPCSISKLNCIRMSKIAKSCNCSPKCKKVLQQLSLEGSPMNAISSNIDPIFHKINVNTSIVLFIRVRIIDSRIYNSVATETWITLLSSLGGVFNMFLGVGLFSALEVLFLVFVRIPNAISRPAQLQNDNVHLPVEIK